MGKVRLLSYNVKLLPDIGRVGAFWEAHMKDRTRARHIAGRLASAEKPWDIVCLQEVFDEDQRKILTTGLRKHVGGKPLYREFVTKSDDDDFLHEDSGLFLASRRSIRFHRFEEYHDAEGTDAWSDKGVLAAAFDTKSVLDGTTLIVYSTHMQAHKFAAETRLKQLKQLRRFMQRTLGRLRHPDRCAVVVCGDLNIIAEHIDTDGTMIGETEEYCTLQSALGDARDLYRELHARLPRPHGATWDPQANPKMIRGNGRKERLDYIFAIDSISQPEPGKPRIQFRRLRAEHVDVERFPHPRTGSLSDHYGVGATLSIERC